MTIVTHQHNGTGIALQRHRKCVTHLQIKVVRWPSQMRTLGSCQTTIANAKRAFSPPENGRIASLA